MDSDTSIFYKREYGKEHYRILPKGTRCHPVISKILRGNGRSSFSTIVPTFCPNKNMISWEDFEYGNLSLNIYAQQ